MEKGRNAITLGQPVITPRKTESLRGDWVTSGTVTFSILQGGNPVIGSLEIPYRDAASEPEALRQALGPLEVIVSQFAEMLARLKADEADTEAVAVRDTPMNVVAAA